VRERKKKVRWGGWESKIRNSNQEIFVVRVARSSFYVLSFAAEICVLSWGEGRVYCVSRRERGGEVRS
jgi:hypothetical protein